MKVYQVKSVANKTIKLTGKAEDELWEKATVLSDFTSPWGDEKVDKTQFRALHSQTHLYLNYRVADGNVHIDKTDNTKASINNSDRVEVFLRRNAQLDPYYCLEIDPSPRVMDFIAKPNRDIDFHWNWPKEDFEVKSFTSEAFFNVEIAISLDSLKHFQLIKENIIEAGLFRAKYQKQADGSMEPTWITWVDPRTEMPDFHVPSAFGLLELEDFTSA